MSSGSFKNKIFKEQRIDRIFSSERGTLEQGI